MRLKKFIKKLSNDKSGVAMVEFAVSLPFFVGIGMYGIEISNMSIVNMSLSQTALNLADNASRLGQNSGGIVTPTITENDVLQVFEGARIQSRNLNMLENGRIILSSLETNDDDDQQIRWQRCKGLYDFDSVYGAQGTNGTDNSRFVGMGKAGREVQATTGTAVMFVELRYDYEPLFGTLFMKERVFAQEAAFNIRDDRNLSAGLADTGQGTPATCDLFTAT